MLNARLPRKTLIIGLFLLLFIAIHADAAEKKIILKPEIAFRAGPSVNAAKIGSLKYGATVKVKNANGPEAVFLDVTAHWAEVESSGKRGWVFGYFLGDIKDEKFYTISDGKVVLQQVSVPSVDGAITKIGNLHFSTCALGQTYTKAGCTGEPRQFEPGENTGANTPCTQLALAGKRWRVPSYQEAVKIKGSAVARNAPKSGGGFFWTNTTDTTAIEEIWKVIDYNTWKDRATFVEPGYMICVADN